MRTYWTCRHLLFGLIGLTLLLVGAGAGLTQFQMRGPGGPGGGPGGPGGWQGRSGGFNFNDPNFLFNIYAKGADVLVIANTESRRDPQLRDKLAAYAQQIGVTNGVLTREQFAGFHAQVLVPAFQARTQGGGGMPGAAPGGTSPGGQGGSQNDEERARERFRRLDKNNDGVISPEEAQESSSLREEFSHHDTNKNGVIEWDEYKAYYAARSAYRREQWQQNGGGSWGQGGPGGPGPEGPDGQPMPQEAPRPVVYRAGHLPKELTDKAPWFLQMDRDKDAQVALWEWKEAGRSTADFRTYDLNMDGFITVEEVLRLARKGTASTTALAQAGTGETGTPGTPTLAAPGMPGGGKGGFMRGAGPGGGWQGRGSGGPPGGGWQGRGSGGTPGGGWPGRGSGGFSRGIRGGDSKGDNKKP